MKRAHVIAAVVLLLTAASLLRREFLRGTFDPVERGFVAWLCANTRSVPPLPPLTLVLYDKEASEFSGAQSMTMQDAALFARAASRLGAAAAGVEGLSGNPSRMIEAAGRVPLFGGFAPDEPPGRGWTVWKGDAAAGWMELPGLVESAASRFPAGFFLPPVELAGPRRVVLAARNSGRPVLSLSALAWIVSGDGRRAEARVMPGRIESGGHAVPLDGSGAAYYLSDGPGHVISLTELLVESEKHEREGGASPLRGHLLVLCRATPDVARIKGAGDVVSTPAELWAQSWGALRGGRMFILPGWWYPGVLAAAGFMLCLGVRRRSRAFGAGAGVMAFLVFLLFALGVFDCCGLLLPLVPSMATLLIGILLGRFFAQSGKAIGSSPP